MTTGWGAVGGIAFSRRSGFPSPSAPAADWVWLGGIREAIAAVLSLAIWLVSWVLLDLDGPKPRLGGDLWELLGAAIRAVDELAEQPAPDLR